MACEGLYFCHSTRAFCLSALDSLPEGLRVPAGGLWKLVITNYPSKSNGLPSRPFWLVLANHVDNIAGPPRNVKHFFIRGKPTPPGSPREQLMGIRRCAFWQSIRRAF